MKKKVLIVSIIILNMIVSWNLYMCSMSKYAKASISSVITIGSLYIMIRYMVKHSEY